MNNYFFDKFEEVEESIRHNAPKIIYKYRDWDNLYHRDLITKQIIWFEAPRDLNDPHDIRVPVKFDYTEIEHPIFFKKLKAYYKINNPNIAYPERDLIIICENKLDEIRKDPKAYFEKSYR